jgi:MFS transporter, DHA3 family, macrolide efflux protein
MTNVSQINENLFRSPRFLIWWIASAQNQLGSSLSAIAFSYLIYERTNSAGAMSLALGLSFLPTLFAPIAGALIDRWSIKAPVVLSDFFRGLLQITIAYLAIRFNNQLPLYIVYISIFLNAIIGLFSGPASSVALKNLVADENIARANSLLGATNQTMGIIGLLVGGIAASYFGSALTILIDGITFLLFSLIVYIFIAFPKKEIRADAEKSHIFQDIASGFAFLKNSSLLVGIAITSFVINALAVPLQTMLPKQIFQLDNGAALYGGFLVANIIGMIIGNAYIFYVSKIVKVRYLIGIGMMIAGLSFAIVAISPSILFYYLGAIILGLGMSYIGTSSSVLIQHSVPNDYLGRVGSFITMFATLAMPLTSFLISPLVDKLPFLNTFLSLGIAISIIGFTWLIFINRTFNAQVKS